MPTSSISSPFPIFTDIDGQPLENGYIFIGVANLGPIGNPINVYWDAALTVPATQPIRTIGGYPVNNGTPARLYVNSQYSIQVQNRNGSVIYSAPVDNDFLSSENVSYLPSGTGAVATTVQTKLRETVSVKDFGAVGDGVTNDAAAVSAMFAYANTLAGVKLVFPLGDYIINSALPQLTVPVVISGASSGITAPSIGTKLTFAAGIAGISLSATAQNSKIENIYLKSLSSALGTNDGIVTLAHATQLQNVVCDGFGRHGFNFDTSISGNCNNSVLIACRAVNNKSNGFNIAGGNSNVITLVGPDSSTNGGYGYNISVSAVCSFISPHADQNIAGDYYDNGSSNHYYNVYSEAAGTFLLDTNCFYAVIDASTYAPPTITNNSSSPHTNSILVSGTQNYLHVGGSVAGGSASATLWVDPTGDSSNGIVFLGKGGSQVNRVVAGFHTFDFGSVAAQSVLTTTFTLIGAKVGSPCSISTSQAQTAGLILRADCFTTNVITITIANITTAPIDPDNVTYRVAQIAMVA